MDARFVITLIMGILLLSWVIFCGIQFFRSCAEMTIRSGLTGHVKCEKCGTEYDVTAAEFTKSHMSRSRSMTRTQVDGAAFVNRRTYTYYAKKFFCPCCSRKRYAQVLNINELSTQMEKPGIRAGIRWLIFMIAGGVIIMSVMSIPMHFANRAAEQRTEEMRQEMYEEMKDRYGL